MSKLKALKACKAATNWADAVGCYKTAWDSCERGDWMLWIAHKASIDLRVLTKASVECAKLVEYLMIHDESIEALRVSERFADGLATIEELNAAASVAYDAANGSKSDYASVYSLNAAAAAAAAATVYFFYSAAAAANAANAANAAKKDTLKKCADICRKYIDYSEIEKFLNNVQD